MLKKVLRLFSLENNLPTIFVILIGSLTWLITIVRSGIKYSFGMGFWGPNSHDGLWHIALSKSLSNFTLENPIFAGEGVKNYHIGFDLVLGVVSKILKIDPAFLYFQIFPIIFSFGIGILASKFVYNLTKSRRAGIISTFFIYFSGGLGPIVHMIRYARLGGDSMFWAQSAATTLINPPFAFSLLLILIFSNIYLKHQNKIDLKNGFVLALLLFFIFNIKVYAGIVVFLSFGAICFYKSLYTKKHEGWAVLISAGALSFLSYYPINSTSASLIVFKPFWFLETMMLFGDRFHFERYYFAMTNYKLSGNLIKLIVAYFVAFIIFFVGNLGVRIVGLFSVVGKVVKKNISIFVFLMTMIITGTIIPMLFVQEGTAWNTIQFFYYTLFVASLLSGIVLDNFIEKVKVFYKILTILLLIFINLAVTITTLKHYTGRFPHTYVSNDQLKALDFLSKKPDGIVLSLQIKDQKYDENVFQVIPIHEYDSVAYVSAFSGKNVFFEDEVNLNIMNYDWIKRKEMVEKFIKEPNNEAGKNFLEENSIKYIYLVRRNGVGLHEETLNINNVFDNDEVIVYKTL